MNEAISLAKPVTIAVIADVHYGTASSMPTRRTEIADMLLMRTTSHLNRLVHPDITLLLGDVLDDGTSCGAEENLWHIRSILDQLDAPYIAVPGNHDGDVDSFYRVFTRPKHVEDICGVRFVPFLDREEPGYNAHRSAKDLARLRTVRNGHPGPIVTLQHVCLFPPGQSLAPYNYTNADEVITAMKEANVLLSLSGHYHRGAEDTRDGNITFVNAPGLCEAPFPFIVVRIDEGQIQSQRHELGMPALAPGI